MNILHHFLAFFGNNKKKKATSNLKIELSPTSLAEYRRCRRCFYLSQKFKIRKPGMISASLALVVDTLLKKEFDIYRDIQQPHPLFKENNIDAIPFKHPQLDDWRRRRKGLRFAISDSLVICGELDDVWLNTTTNELIVAEYKTMAKASKDFETIDEVDERHKRQVAVYQWLLRKNGFQVSNKAYFVYYNANKGLFKFNNQLLFDTKVFMCELNDFWIEKEAIAAHKCILTSVIPFGPEDCEYCQYLKSVKTFLR